MSPHLEFLHMTKICVRDKYQVWQCWPKSISIRSNIFWKINQNILIHLLRICPVSECRSTLSQRIFIKLKFNQSDCSPINPNDPQLNKSISIFQALQPFLTSNRKYRTQLGWWRRRTFIIYMCEIVKLRVTFSIWLDLLRGLHWYGLQQQGKFVKRHTHNNLLFSFENYLQTKGPACSEGELSGNENKSGIKNSIWAQQWDLFPLQTPFTTSSPLFPAPKEGGLTHFPIISQQSQECETCSTY